MNIECDTPSSIEDSECTTKTKTTEVAIPLTPSVDATTEPLFSIGCRVQDRKTDHRGSVKYIGLVQGSEGIWLGVDWDSPSRGRHDGCHNTERYFTARYPTSGSFVRYGRVLHGIDMEMAVREKYQTPPPDTALTEQMLQHAINARFVQFVGMDKTCKQQSALETLRLVELKECLVACAGNTPLQQMLPRLTQLHLSSCLLQSWQHVADIVKQLPRLHMLNLSGNRLTLPTDPTSLTGDLQHVSHLVMNSMIDYTWQDLLSCAAMFTRLQQLQVAYNNLSSLGPVPAGALDELEVLDVGANPLMDWCQLQHLSQLPRLSELNANNSQLSVVQLEQDPGFGALRTLYIANNPMDNWSSVCQLSKLPNLLNLKLGFELKADDYFPEFTYAIIRSLKSLNCTVVTRKEKRDYELFYLKTFGRDYYAAGGTEEADKAELTPEFVEKHPTYLQLVRELGSPYMETAPKTTVLRGQQLPVVVAFPDGRQLQQSLLPSLKVARLKMTIKRTLKLPHSTVLHLSYTPAQGPAELDIPLSPDHRTVDFFSLGAGDTINVRLS